MTNHIHLVVIPEHADSLARTLGRTHSEYAQALNHFCRRSGHLWQNRLYSCPLDAAHLEETLRYVDLNPVRAGLSIAAWEYPWSSARAHCVESTVDPILDLNWIARVDGWDHTGWSESLGSAIPQEHWIAVRHATHTGEPLGSREFVTNRTAGRPPSARLRTRPSEEAHGAGGAGPWPARVTNGTNMPYRFAFVTER
jgi:putative transposase